MLPNKSEIEEAAKMVYGQMSPTPQYVWPQINERTGSKVWIKHENHTPIGAFKARGNIAIVDWLKREHADISGVVTATRGNHGQGLARAANAAGFQSKIIVPRNNSLEKNAAMRAFGGEVIEYGSDFSESCDFAKSTAEKGNLFMVPPFHREIVKGVATYGLELFSEAGELDTVYVPVGCGSGICSLIAVKEALNLKTKIVGVVSEKASAAKQSFELGRITETNAANTFADGLAVRVPIAEAFEIYSNGAERFISVSDDEIADAMRLYFSATHNVTEGAGAASLAALMKDKHATQGKEVGVIITGANIDTALFQSVLQGSTPQVS